MDNKQEELELCAQSYDVIDLCAQIYDVIELTDT